MPTAVIDGIATRYEVLGSGPPILMYAPGGFNAVIETWSTQGVYAKSKLLDYPRSTFAASSSIAANAANRRQGRAVAHPEMVAGMALYWPVGGVKYRMSSHQRFADHLAFVQSHGLEGVVALVGKEGKHLGADPRGGPWASAIKRDPAFAAAYAEQNPEQYKLICSGMCRALFDRDTSPGAEPEDLMRFDISALIVPGQDATHATSAARYLEECLPRADYWDVPVEQQTEANAPERVLGFLQTCPVE